MDVLYAILTSLLKVSAGLTDGCKWKSPLMLLSLFIVFQNV